MALPDQLEITAKIQISKPASVVYKAIIQPDQMSNYFIEKSTGVMESGKTVKWKWPEFDVVADIEVDRTRPNEFVAFYWLNGDRRTMVEISLDDRTDSTVVIITEKSMPLDEKGISWAKGNSEGWANFLACLKAWVEYGINLRKGAFDFMKVGG